MGKLRVFIVSEGHIVDIQEFEDPRLRFIEDFNQLNKETPFKAVLQPYVGNRSPARRHVNCTAAEHCRSKE